MPSLSLPPLSSPPRAPRTAMATLLGPVLMSGGLWLVTRSSVALVLAAAGPLLAVLSWCESRGRARSARRRGERDRSEALGRLRAQLVELHEIERVELGRAAPGAVRALGAPQLPVLWAGGSAVGVEPGAAAGGVAPLLRLGEGVLPSTVRIGGEAADQAEQRLQHAAARLERAPVLVRGSGLIAVCGPRVAALACLRGLIVQFAAAARPDERGIALHPATQAALAVEELAWVQSLPHAGRDGLPTTVFALFDRPEQVPPGCAIVLDAGELAAARVLVGAPDGLLDERISPAYVSRAQATAFASVLAARAGALGLGASSRVPERVRFDELPRDATTAGILPAVIGCSAAGFETLDLVADGPHAIVAGVTGSGKSELLVSWVAAMAAARGPSLLNVLLVDFKGGTAFAPLAALPHTVGVITDLAGGQADRALRSLSAELRRREAALAQLGLRDIADADERMPRLVVVIDEFAALLEAFPDFAALFADIAARGRALGIHLVLATQRPSGVVREALLANCPLRLSLRVHSEADSRWVVGTDAAARLRSTHAGRGVIAADGETRLVQFALTTREDLARVAASWAAAELSAAPLATGTDEPAAVAGPRAMRPWAEPLPARLGWEEVEASVPDAVPDGVLLGLADAPELQGRVPAAWSDASGSLLLLGAARSGKSSLLALIGESACARSPDVDVIAIGAERERAWDAVAEAVAACDSGDSAARPRLLLLDDVDALLARYGDELASAWCERLARLLRDGAARGVRIVIAAQRMTPPLRPLAELADETVLLRLPSRQDHVLAGGVADLYDERMPPGGAVWRGRRVQFLAPGEGPVSAASADATVFVRRPARLEKLALQPGRGELQAVVTRTPLRLIESLLAHGVPEPAIVDLAVHGPLDRPTADQLRERAADAASLGLVVVGAPEAWSTEWSLFAALRARSPVVFLGCDAAELRALSRSRVTPPPLDALPDRCWVLRPDGEVRRGSFG